MRDEIMKLRAEAQLELVKVQAKIEVYDEVLALTDKPEVETETTTNEY